MEAAAEVPQPLAERRARRKAVNFVEGEPVATRKAFLATVTQSHAPALASWALKGPGTGASWGSATVPAKKRPAITPDAANLFVKLICLRSCFDPAPCRFVTRSALAISLPFHRGCPVHP